MRGWMNARGVLRLTGGDRHGHAGRRGRQGHGLGPPGLRRRRRRVRVFGVQEDAVSDGRGMIKIDTSLTVPSVYLDALGMTGLTAYFGLLDTGKLKPGDTVVVSGAVSQYNETQVHGPANYMMLLVTRSSMEGMLVFDYEDRYPEATAELAGWLREGKLVAREHVVHGGVSDFPETLLMLFDGVNTGKLVLALDSTR